MTTPGSNSADRIAELRKRIASNKSKMKRAETTMWYMKARMNECYNQIERDKREIRSMGGVVKS